MVARHRALEAFYDAMDPYNGCSNLVRTRHLAENDPQIVRVGLLAGSPADFKSPAIPDSGT